MSTLLAADDVPAGVRRDYWLHALDDAIGPLDLRTGMLDGRDRLRSGAVGPVRVVELSAGGAGVRDAEGERDPPRGRRPVAVVFPRALLPLRPDDTARLTGVRIAGDHGAAALVSGLARRLVDHVDDHDAAGGTRVGTAVLDLLSAALASRLERTDDVPADTRRRALLLQVHAFIEQRLADPELSPGMIAEAHHISVRYLYRLFEAEQTSVAAWIRRRRLERCRRDLLEPALRHYPVSTIAARWGMRSAPHFNRAFRAAYGVTPGEYRLLGDSR